MLIQNSNALCQVKALACSQRSTLQRADRGRPVGAGREAGFTLFEVLVALLVVALGLLGILGMQLRTLADTQSGVRQAQAIRLIESLSERIQLNPNSMSSEVAANYVTAWGDVTGTVPSNCDAGCTAKDLAKYEIAQWKKRVKETVLGDANVFFVNDENGLSAGNRRQLGVMVSWRENELDQGNATAAEKKSFLKYFHVASKDINGQTISCPEGSSCHLQFITLAGRCVTNRDGGATNLRYFCADGSVQKLPAAP